MSQTYSLQQRISRQVTANMLLYTFSALCRNLALVLVPSADDQARNVSAGFTTVTCCIVTFCRAGCTWHARVFLSRGNCKASFMHKAANWSYTRLLSNTTLVKLPVHCWLILFPGRECQNSAAQCTQELPVKAPGTAHRSSRFLSAKPPYAARIEMVNTPSSKKHRRDSGQDRVCGVSSVFFGLETLNSDMDTQVTFGEEACWSLCAQLSPLIISFSFPKTGKHKRWR